MKTWIVFSDLHVTSRSLEVCLAVLRRVHTEAVARNAGILFCGDFWHERGRVPVAPLNAVLEVMRDWTQETVFMPGNHDQVDLGGTEHGLTAIAAAVSVARCIDVPTMLGSALVIPYRRDAEEVIAAIAEHPEARALLCHIDVVGAFMNEAIQAGHGILPERLPKCPIYTGHYHKPHAVPGHEHITYVGSQWQTGYSEAGQQKRLLLLDGETWEVLEEIPVDIGPRHFSCDVAKLDWPTGLRAGDRVIVQADSPEPQWFAADRERVAAWRAAGITTDVRVRPSEASSRIDDAEKLPTQELWQRYAKVVDLQPELIAVGLTVLQETAVLAPEAERRFIEFDSVRVVGYGPFVDELVYPLGNRGAVLVTGRNVDMPGADSNGAGKTTLVMAAVWALTGETDPRPDGAGMKGLGKEVINEAGKAAEVELRLHLNGDEVVVRRRMTATSHSLSVHHRGLDITQQDLTLTQALVDEMLGTQHLCRVAFQGQHELRGFLEATDKAAKDALAEIVDISAWIAAALVASKRADEANSAVVSAEQQRVSAGDLIGVAATAVEQATARIAEWDAGRAQRIADLEAQAATAIVEADERRCVAGNELAAATAAASAAEAADAAWARQRDADLAAATEAASGVAARDDEWRTAHTADLTAAGDRLRSLDTERREWSDERARRAATLRDAPLPPSQVADIARLREGKRELPPEPRMPPEPQRPPDPQQPVEPSLPPEFEAAETAARSALAEAEGRLRSISTDGQAAKAALQRVQDLPPTCDACGQAVGQSHKDRLCGEADAVVVAARAEYRAAQTAAEEARGALAAAQDALSHARIDHRATIAQLRLVYNEAVAKQHLDYNAALTKRRDEHRDALDRWQQIVDTIRAEDTARRTAVADIEDAWRRSASERYATCMAETWPRQEHFDGAADRVRTLNAARSPHADARLRAEALVREIMGRRAPDNGAAAARRRATDAEQALAMVDVAVRQARARVDAEAATTNPYHGVLADAQARAAAADKRLGDAEMDVARTKLAEALAKQLVKHFGRQGVQSFVLEAALADLQRRAQGYLDELSDGYLRLEIGATSTTAKGGVSERISRRVLVRQADGGYVERKIPQLSGGQRRRVIVATTLAFAEFCAARTGLSTSMVVFDEVFQHLDAAGRAKIDGLLRTMPYRTILVISHDADLADAFDHVDLVTMSGDRSRVESR